MQWYFLALVVRTVTHRVLCDLGKQPTIPMLDPAYNGLLGAV